MYVHQPTPPMQPEYGKPRSHWTAYEKWIFSNWDRKSAVFEICFKGTRTEKAFEDREYETNKHKKTQQEFNSKEEMLKFGKIKQSLNELQFKIRTQAKEHATLVAAANVKKQYIDTLLAEYATIKKELNINDNDIFPVALPKIQALNEQARRIIPTTIFSQ